MVCGYEINGFQNCIFGWAFIGSQPKRITCNPISFFVMDNYKTLLIPARLIPGDTIGIVAPSSPFNRKTFDQGIRALESMGFRTSVPDDIYKKDGYLAGSDSHRAALVNRLFTDKAIKAILCAKGGFGAIRILPLLDYPSIRENPKIFVGFSDVSALLTVLYKRCGLVTYHGPMVTFLGNATEKTKDAMRSAFSSNIRPEFTAKNGTAVKAGLASGPVVGGNLTTLCHLLGTPFEPEFKNHILLLEDRGEESYRIDRMLTQMKYAGCFDGLSGLVLGSFEDCGKLNDIFRIVADTFKDMDIPILAGFDIGHGRDNITIPIGIEATLDADRKRLRFHKPATV